MCIKCGCGKKKGEPGYGKGKVASTMAANKIKTKPMKKGNMRKMVKM